MTRAQYFTLLEDGALAGAWGGRLHHFLAASIIVSLLILVLAIEPDLGISSRVPPFSETLMLIVLGSEYGFRLWAAPDNPRFAAMGPVAARWMHASSAGALLDLYILAGILAFLTGSLSLERATALALPRCLKLVRYSPMLSALGQALMLGRQALFASAIIVGMIGMIFGSAIFLLERAGQPEEFGHLTSVIWWTISTVTGASGDDSTPDTRLGQVLYVILSISGFLVLALPMGVIASAFDATLAKRSFVVTWNMVARVPLFRSLPAAAIAAIAEQLNAESFEDGAVIIRRGEPGERMYFILGGSVEVATEGGPIRLDSGDYFGEHALLTDEPRSATVNAKGRTKLLSLSKRDLAAVIERAPGIKDALRQTDIARRGA
ncbi:cyclic nucleotide-gated ion channel [Candidatus Raskinella chloraquaticus]|uniref:Cyclic nucleotide-binding domain-containing protein n=1 Tax=Candidatus Raskinella chloraquaticus TaxID=1951219 RepID=A0A1W9HXX8_9HYPH|nr:MAG: hypothetical protein A4S15_08140 [Proteobacteria bacterium SG_bin8]